MEGVSKFDFELIRASLTKPWSPIDVAEFNGQVLRAALFDGTYQWHTHTDDECFWVWRGCIAIELKGRKPVILSQGNGTVVPKGQQHRPVANEPSVVLMIEPATLKSEGDI